MSSKTTAADALNIPPDQMADQEKMRPAFEYLLNRARPPAGCRITAAALHSETGNVIIIDDDNIGADHCDCLECSAPQRVQETLEHLKHICQQRTEKVKAVSTSTSQVSLNINAKTVLIGLGGAAVAAAMLYAAGVMPEISPLSATGTTLAIALLAGTVAATASIGRTMIQARMAEHATRKLASQHFNLNGSHVVASTADRKRTVGIFAFSKANPAIVGLADCRIGNTED